MLEQQINEILFGRCQLVPGQRVLVGFSGGADSLCLLHLLKSQPIQIIAAHFDHGLRAESVADAARCRVLAQDWGTEFVDEVGRVREFAVENRLSLEEAARILRYRFLFDAAKTNRADAVAVAHHADDQVETVLMHLLRGAGPEGLSGMQFRAGDPLGRSSLPLVRPLLGIWRADIAQYCHEHALTPLEDATNLDPTYFRNRIRHELIPNLETYNPKFKQHLWQTAAVVAEENDRLDAEALELTSTAVIRQGSGWVLVNQTRLRGQPQWILRRLVRNTVFHLQSNLRDVSFAEVEKAVEALLALEAGKTYQLTDSLEIVKYNDETALIAARQAPLDDLWPQLVSSDIGKLSMGVRQLAGGWCITLQSLDSVPKTPAGKDRWSCLLDAGKLEEPLFLSMRRSGDTFMPFGMGGQRLKLGDFFTNEHLPVRARDAWPLVRSAGQIVWVPGYRPAEFCRLTSATQRVLVLTLEQKKEQPV